METKYEILGPKVFSEVKLEIIFKNQREFDQLRSLLACTNTKLNTLLPERLKFTDLERPCWVDTMLDSIHSIIEEKEAE